MNYSTTCALTKKPTMNELSIHSGLKHMPIALSCVHLKKNNQPAIPAMLEETWWDL